ncbi:hypothetical protein D3C87_1419820 [compost metagenome]
MPGSARSAAPARRAPGRRSRRRCPRAIARARPDGRRAGCRHRQYRPRRGKTRRSRTWPAAGRRAGCAWPCGTSCPMTRRVPRAGRLALRFQYRPRISSARLSGPRGLSDAVRWTAMETAGWRCADGAAGVARIRSFSKSGDYNNFIAGESCDGVGTKCGWCITPAPSSPAPLPPCGASAR